MLILSSRINNHLMLFEVFYNTIYSSLIWPHMFFTSSTFSYSAPPPPKPLVCGKMRNEQLLVECISQISSPDCSPIIKRLKQFPCTNKWTEQFPNWGNRLLLYNLTFGGNVSATTTRTKLDQTRTYGWSQWVYLKESCLIRRVASIGEKSVHISVRNYFLAVWCNWDKNVICPLEYYCILDH